MKKSIPPAMAIAALFLLLTHPALSLEGAKSGLLAWYQTVLPTLLPFMICSNVIASLNGIHLMAAPVRPLLGKLFCLSDAGCYALVSGLLCGYPMGAKICGEFVSQKQISPREGRRLLSISNHPSPMFLLGYAASLLDSSIPVPMLLCAVYLPVVPLAFLSRAAYRVQDAGPFALQKKQPHLSFDASMMHSFEVMIKIGGYMMLFSILARFIGQIPFLPASAQALLLGAVEITTGMQAIARNFSGPVQGLLLCCAASFGGICGVFQTKSVLADSSLPLSHYVLWKLLHASLSMATFALLTLFVLP